MRFEREGERSDGSGVNGQDLLEAGDESRRCIRWSWRE
jgi:hypothetical protein